MRKKYQLTNELAQMSIKYVLEALERSEKDIFFSLGIAYVYKNAPPGVHYFAHYEKVGMKFWNTLSAELYDIICNSANKQPKEWVQEIISGDIRNLIVGIVTAIVTTFDVSVGIAIPATALVIKIGLLSYCKRKPKKSTKTVKEMLKGNAKTRIASATIEKRDDIP